MKAYTKASSKKHTVSVTHPILIRSLFFCFILFFLSFCAKAQNIEETNLAVPNTELSESNSDSIFISSNESKQELKSNIIHVKGNTKIYITANTVTNISQNGDEFIVIQKTHTPQVVKKSPKKEKQPEKITKIKETKTEEKITKKSPSNYLSFPFKESQSYGQGYFPGVASANPFSWTKKQISAVDLVKHDFYPILLNSSGIISYSREIKSVFSENQPYISRPPPARLS